LVDPSTRRDLLPVAIGDRDRLTKYTGRLPRENLFGNLTQAWIYDPEIMKPSKGTGTGWILVNRAAGAGDIDASERRQRIWQMYQQLSKVPLLEHWQDAVLDATPHYVADLSQPPFPTFGRVMAWKVTIGDDFSSLISSLVSRRVLQLDPPAPIALAS
jgi:hypothetical protein